MYSYGSPHMTSQKQDDQHERTFSSYVRIRVVVLKTYLGRWTIGRSGERGSGISVLPARYDDDDDEDTRPTMSVLNMIVNHLMVRLYPSLPLCCILICRCMHKHNDTIKTSDTVPRKIYLSLDLKGLCVRESWRPNRIYWPPLYWPSAFFFFLGYDWPSEYVLLPSLEWHDWSSSSGNNCHAVHRSLSSGASVCDCTVGF